MTTQTVKNINSIKKFYEIWGDEINNNFDYLYNNRYHGNRCLSKTAKEFYETGVLDIYDYDLYLTLVKCGVNTKPVKEYKKVLDHGCTRKHRENIRNEYRKLIWNVLYNYKYHKEKLQ